MELPLLALPDAPHAADTAGQRDEDGYTVDQQQRLQSFWDKKRMSCFDKDALRMYPAYAQQPDLLAKDFAEFIMDAGFNKRCDCNNEPSIRTDNGETAAVFHNELHYNRFMTQLVLCSADDVKKAPATSLTRQVRNKLMGMREGIGFTNAQFAWNSAQYYTTVAARVFGTGASAALVVTGFTGMAMSMWCMPILVAVLWGFGMSVSSDALNDIAKNRMNLDGDATAKMQEWVENLAEADRDGATRQNFYNIFKEHKRLVHKAMFEALIPIAGGTGGSTFIDKIMVQFPGSSTKPYTFRKDTEVDVHIPGGLLDPENQGTIIEESEEDGKGEKYSS